MTVHTHTFVTTLCLVPAAGAAPATALLLVPAGTEARDGPEPVAAAPAAPAPGIWSRVDASWATVTATGAATETGGVGGMVNTAGAAVSAMDVVWALVVEVK